MQDPEDKGPRYRLVMFVALAAIVVPGFFLLNWIGDNGVSKLFRQMLGLDQRPRVTRTVTPAASAAGSPAVVVTVAATAAASSTPAGPPTSSPAPATSVSAPPSATPTSKPVPTATPVPAITAAPQPTNTPRPAATATPRPQALGYGQAVPAYGGAAVMRAEPSTEAEQVGSIPLDERVLVIRIVEGEAIDPVESRWWEVEYGGVTGFVYYKLIKLD